MTMHGAVQDLQGTEPKIKFYMGVKGTGLEDADKKLEELTDAVSEIVGL